MILAFFRWTAFSMDIFETLAVGLNGQNITAARDDSRD
jgi:hypothetical protein